MAKVTVSVEIFDHEADKAIGLCEQVDAKHVADGATSVLTQLLDMDIFRSKIADSKSKRATAKDLHRQAEALMQEADIMLGFEQGQTSYTEGTLYNSLTKIRDLLLALNKGHEEALGAWGFDVVIKTSTPGEPEEPVV